MNRGAQSVVAYSLILDAIMMIILCQISETLIFQTLLLVKGIIGATQSAGYLLLRTQVTPKETQIESNIAFALIERSGQLLGPGIAGLLLWKLSAYRCMYGITIGLAIAAILLLRLDILATSDHKSSKDEKISYASLIKLFKYKTFSIALLLPTLGYGLILGGLKPYLLWSTINTLQRPENQWTILLTAHGIGAAAGSFIAPSIIQKLGEYVSLFSLFLSVRIGKVIILLLLVFASSLSSACGLLFLTGIPEVIGSVCFFTLLQKNLTLKEQAILHTCSLPWFNTLVAGGAMLGGLYTAHWINLSSLWFITCLLSILLSIPSIWIGYRSKMRSD